MNHRPGQDVDDSIEENSMFSVDFVTVVIPYFQNEATLAACLESFSNQCHQPNGYELIVVDDASPRPAAPIIESTQLGVPCRLIVNPTNLGQAGATNVGIESARGAVVLLSCADIIAAPNLVHEHLRLHRKSADRIAVLGNIPYAEHIESTPFLRYLVGKGPQFSFDLIENPSNVEAKFFYAPNISVRRSDLIEVGLFDQEFRYGCQDWDLGLRLNSSGVRIVFNRGAVANHDHPMNLKSYLPRQRKVAHAFLAMLRKYPNTEAAFFVEKTIELARPIECKLEMIVEAANRKEQYLEDQKSCGTNLVSDEEFKVEQQSLEKLYGLALTIAKAQGFLECPELLNWVREFRSSGG